MEAGEPGMVTAVIMADATGKRRIDPRGRVVGSVQVNFFFVRRASNLRLRGFTAIDLRVL